MTSQARTELLEAIDAASRNRAAREQADGLVFCDCCGGPIDPVRPGRRFCTFDCQRKTKR